MYREREPRDQPNTILTHNEEGYIIATAPDYTVITHIPPEHETAVSNALEAAKLFAEGVNTNTETIAIVSFKERVKAAFLTQENPSFSSALVASTLGFIKEYKEHHPEHIDGFQRSFQAGGFSGLERILEGTKHSLKKAKEGKLQDPLSLEPFKQEHFRSHSDPEQNEQGIYIVTNEMQCRGDKLSQALIRQINAAAIHLAHNEIVASYPEDTQEVLPQDFKDKLREVVFVA